MLKVFLAIVDDSNWKFHSQATIVANIFHKLTANL